MLGDVVQNKVRRHPWQALVIDDHDGSISQGPLLSVDAICRGVRTMRAEGTAVPPARHPYVRIIHCALQEERIARVRLADGELVLRRQPAESPERIDAQSRPRGLPSPPESLRFRKRSCWWYGHDLSVRNIRHCEPLCDTLVDTEYIRNNSLGA